MTASLLVFMLITNITAITMFIIPKAKLPPIVGNFLPNFFKNGIDKKLPTNCTILAIRGEYIERVGL